MRKKKQPSCHLSSKIGLISMNILRFGW